MQNPSRHVACRRTSPPHGAPAPLRARHRCLRLRGTAGRRQHARRRMRRTCGRGRAADQLPRVRRHGGDGACCAAPALCGSCGSPHRTPAARESARIAARVHSASARVQKQLTCKSEATTAHLGRASRALRAQCGRRRRAHSSESRAQVKSVPIRHALWRCGLRVRQAPSASAAPLQARASKQLPADWAAPSHAARACAAAAQRSGREGARALGARLAEAARHAVDHCARCPVVRVADSVPSVIGRLALEACATLRHLADARIARRAARPLLAGRGAPLRRGLWLFFLRCFVAAAAVVNRRRCGVRTSRRHARRRGGRASHSPHCTSHPAQRWRR